jgi:hypothetical protein
LDLSEVILHFFSGVSCLVLITISFCNWTNIREENQFKRTLIRNNTLLSEYSFDSPLRISAKKYKVEDNDIVCTLNIKIDGNEQELKRTYKNFVLLDLKVRCTLSYSWRKSMREILRMEYLRNLNYLIQLKSNQ